MKWKVFLKIVLWVYFLFAVCEVKWIDTKYIELVISKYPERIVYIKDKDDCLDLKGGVITLTNEYNATHFVTMDNSNKWPLYFVITSEELENQEILDDYDDRLIELSTDIDFHVEGNYTVTFIHEGVSVSYPVIVIDQNYIKDRLYEVD
jgi:hypothetical protein